MPSCNIVAAIFTNLILFKEHISAYLLNGCNAIFNSHNERDDLIHKNTHFNTRVTNAYIHENKSQLCIHLVY